MYSATQSNHSVYDYGWNKVTILLILFTLDGDDGESENDYNVIYVTFNIADPNNTHDVCQLLT